MVKHNIGNRSENNTEDLRLFNYSNAFTCTAVSVNDYTTFQYEICNGNTTANNFVKFNFVESQVYLYLPTSCLLSISQKLLKGFLFSSSSELSPFYAIICFYVKKSLVPMDSVVPGNNYNTTHRFCSYEQN